MEILIKITLGTRVQYYNYYCCCCSLDYCLRHLIPSPSPPCHLFSPSLLPVPPPPVFFVRATASTDPRPRTQSLPNLNLSLSESKPFSRRETAQVPTPRAPPGHSSPASEPFISLPTHESCSGTIKALNNLLALARSCHPSEQSPLPSLRNSTNAITRLHLKYSLCREERFSLDQSHHLPRPSQIHQSHSLTQVSTTSSEYHIPHQTQKFGHRDLILYAPRLQNTGASPWLASSCS